jgi:hypothetical protein
MPHDRKYSLRFACVVTGLSWFFLHFAAQAGATDAARAVYTEKCARCHGADGQGVPGKHETALAGPRSVDELARLIERTMPEDNPGGCVGDEARLVARYIYDEFYSPAARQRKGLDPPLEVELMRLTVPQYRNAVADIIGYFTPTPAEARRRLPEEEPRRRRRRNAEPAAAPAEPPAAGPTDATSVGQPGMRGLYYFSKGMSKANDLAVERVDTRLEFDFQGGGPAEGMPPDQFAIVWEGSLRADETGEYLLRVTTPNGARVYLNLDPTRGLRKLRDDSAAAGQSALIDAWVSSGKLREESARVYLVGGRRYPLRMEFFKYQEPTASIKLEWKPPHGAWSVLDHQSVTTAEVGRSFVVETPFPADDRSQGYERGRSVSHEWQVAATNAAILAADEVAKRLPLLVPFQGTSSDPPTGTEASNSDTAEVDSSETSGESDEDRAARRRSQLQDFVVQFARVAFRRPLTVDEEVRVREVTFTDEADPELAVRRAIVWILCSPEFLYADLSAPDQVPDAHTIAARLALVLWDSVPDRDLMAAAESGQLVTEEQVQSQAYRMLADLRTRHKLRGFFSHWLELEDRDLSKDRQLFPQFDEQVIADLRRSLELFVEDTIWSDSSDYRQLLSAEHLFLNPRLREVYADLEPESASPEAVSSEGTACASEFQPVVFPGQERAGVLTHPYLLSAFAYHNNTSPIHRGVFLTRNIVGRSLKPPPVAVAFKNDEFAPELTMREKITELTRDSNCMACHSVINPLGFALEHYDAVGRWRTSEKDKPVDTKSEYTTETGQTIEVDSARDIAQLALSSESAHRAFIVQMAQHLTKQNPAVYGPTVVEQLRADFAADNFNVQNLIVRIAVMAARHGSSPDATGVQEEAAAATEPSR